jgi:hypothetical protein
MSDLSSSSSSETATPRPGRAASPWKRVSPWMVVGIAVAAAAALSPTFLDFGGQGSIPPAAAPPSVDTIPEGYRDWKLVSVAREEGSLDDIRAVLGNDIAMKAFRDGDGAFPDGSIIARLAWSYDASEANNAAFGKRQSFVAGAPKNGVQFMIKDSKQFASTGGWGFSQFDDGKPVSAEMRAMCFGCHAPAQTRDLVFTRYAR